MDKEYLKYPLKVFIKITLLLKKLFTIVDFEKKFVIWKVCSPYLCYSSEDV
jgi:hypothetical protein